MTDPSSFIDAEVRAEFYLELEDLTREVERFLLLLEDAPDNPAYIRELFRPFHTIKGNAGLMNESEIQQLSHLAESILDEVRQGRHVLTQDMLEGAFQTIDVIRSIAAAKSAAPVRQAVDETTALLKSILREVTGDASDVPAVIAVDPLTMPVLAEQACHGIVAQLCELERMVTGCRRQQDFEPYLSDMFDAVLQVSDLVGKHKGLLEARRICGYLEDFLTILNLSELPFDSDSWQLLDTLRDDAAHCLYPILIANLRIYVHYYNSSEETAQLPLMVERAREAGVRGHMININTHTPPSREEIELFQELQKKFGPQIVFVQRSLGQRIFWKDLNYLLEEAPPVRRTFWQALEVLSQAMQPQ